jgi:hypothetical protein
MLQGDRQDADLNQLVSSNRVLRQQVGPVRCLFLLYEAPPLTEGILFANGLRFHGADIINAKGETVPEVYAAFHEGEIMRLRLWWTVDQPLDQPYVIGTYIGKRAGRGSTEALPQVIFPPGDAVRIDQWQPGQYYIEERSLPLRQQLGSDQYPVFLAVLDPQTGERVTGTGLTDDNLLEISRITVKSY